jgi:hypothetical protein
MVGLVLVGGVIVETFGFVAGWLVETSLCAVGLVIACAMSEPPAAHDPIVADGSELPGSDRLSRSDSVSLLCVIAPAALLSGAGTAVSFWAQTVRGSNPQRMTMLVAVITLAEAAGSMIAARFPTVGVRAQAVLAGIGAVAITAAVALPHALLPVVVGMAFLLGLVHPLRAAAVQQLATDGMRARAASAANACDKVCDTIGLIVAGAWRRGRT